MLVLGGAPDWGPCGCLAPLPHGDLKNERRSQDRIHMHRQGLLGMVFPLYRRPNSVSSCLRARLLRPHVPSRQRCAPWPQATPRPGCMRPHAAAVPNMKQSLARIECRHGRAHLMVALSLVSNLLIFYSVLMQSSGLSCCQVWTARLPPHHLRVPRDHAASSALLCELWRDTPRNYAGLQASGSQPE
jgi:hypothetical protein